MNSKAASISITSILAQMGAGRLRALFSQEPAQVAAWIRATALEGLKEAQLCYGRMLLEGTGVPKDQVAALSWFGRAAAAGDRDAVNMVGRCFDNGWGTDEDPTLAARHYHVAADAGHAWAQYNLGHLYLDGRGVRQDRQRAYAYYLLAAHQHHPRAMNLAGRCCEEGWGTPRDLETAAMWYHAAAQRGYFRGQYNWAMLQLQAGQLDDAAQWFTLAANGGNEAVRATVLVAIGPFNAHAPLQKLAARLVESRKSGIHEA